MIKNTLAEIIFKMFYTKVSQMMTEIDIFKNIKIFAFVAIIVRECCQLFEGLWPLRHRVTVRNTGNICFEF